MELEWRHNLTFLRHSSLMNAICPEISMSICYRIINKNHQINLIIRVFCFDTIAGVGQCPQLQPCRATMKQLLTKDTNLNISHFPEFHLFLRVPLHLFSLSLPKSPFICPSLPLFLSSLFIPHKGKYHGDIGRYSKDRVWAERKKETEPRREEESTGEKNTSKAVRGDRM